MTRAERISKVCASLASVALLAGCTQTVEGTARPVGFGGSGGEEFEKLLTECDAVADDRIRDTIGADAIARSFYGAICRWDAIGASGSIKVTFHWFESGTLDAEREANSRLEYDVADTTVQGRRGIEMRPPRDPTSCGVATSAEDAGIFGWWVQYQAGSAIPDPCEAAATLADLTLNLSR